MLKPKIFCVSIKGIVFPQYKVIFEKKSRKLNASCEPSVQIKTKLHFKRTKALKRKLNIANSKEKTVGKLKQKQN
jgi:hypothetical protein